MLHKRQAIKQSIVYFGKEQADCSRYRKPNCFDAQISVVSNKFGQKKLGHKHTPLRIIHDLWHSKVLVTGIPYILHSVLLSYIPRYV
jgi:hypothetical protein